MAQNLKPIIDEIKSKIANRDEIRDSVLQNLKQTRETVEKTIKQVANQAKDSRIVREYVIPFAESQQADQAFKFLNDKLGTNPLVVRLEKARKSLIDLKVAEAKTAEPVVETQTEAVAEEALVSEESTDESNA